MKDEVTEFSALILALIQDDFPTIKLFGKYGNEGLQRLSDDYFTLGCIDFTISTEHEYDTDY